MLYASAYRIPDHDDRGCTDRRSFLTVNSAGYYEFDEACGATHRKHGRMDYYLSYNVNGLMKVRINRREYRTELADMTHLSVSRFSCIFKNMTGSSPQHYLICFRVEKAMELMLRTNLNIHQIAALTGFEDQLYFSRLFKKYNGVSPKEFIKVNYG